MPADGARAGRPDFDAFIVPIQPLSSRAAPLIAATHKQQARLVLHQGYTQGARSKSIANGLTKRTPSNTLSVLKSSLKTTGTWLSRAAAQICAS